ncbi:hypothetical protein C8R47DRAFT_1224694 [Mycena vitilis]|nr:hypothetical protein C8R47DRAFT_1224694 [Mycena vitilis]
MASVVPAAIHQAVKAFIESASEYNPPRLPPLNTSHWKDLAEKKTDAKAKAVQKSLRRSYLHVGRSTLEHCIVLLLGGIAFDKPEGFTKAIERKVLSAETLRTIAQRIDSRLVENKPARVEQGFTELVGALLVELKFNTPAVAALLYPILGPVVQVAAGTYLGCVCEEEAQDEEVEAPSTQASVSVKNFRLGGEQLFLLNAWEVQKAPAPSPPGTPANGTNALGGDSDSAMGTPSPVQGTQFPTYDFGIEEQHSLEYFSPHIDPSSDSFDSAGPSHINDGDLPQPPTDLNKHKLYPPAVLRKLAVEEMDEDELRDMKSTVDWSPDPIFMQADAVTPGLSQRGFLLDFNPGFGLSGNPDAGDSVLREVEDTDAENIQPALGSGTSLLGAAFVPTSTKGKERANAVASSSKTESGPGGDGGLHGTERSPLTPRNGRSPRGGPSQHSLGRR